MCVRKGVCVGVCVCRGKYVCVWRCVCKGVVFIFSGVCEYEQYVCACVGVCRDVDSGE